MDTLLLVSYFVLRVFMAPWHIVEGTLWFGRSLAGRGNYTPLDVLTLTESRHKLETGIFLLRLFRPILGCWVEEELRLYKEDLATVDEQLEGLL